MIYFIMFFLAVFFLEGVCVGTLIFLHSHQDTLLFWRTSLDGWDKTITRNIELEKELASLKNKDSTGKNQGTRSKKERVQLIKEVKGYPAGTKGIVTKIDGDIVIMDLQKNDEVIEVRLKDIALI